MPFSVTFKIDFTFAKLKPFCMLIQFSLFGGEQENVNTLKVLYICKDVIAKKASHPPFAAGATRKVLMEGMHCTLCAFKFRKDIVEFMTDQRYLRFEKKSNVEKKYNIDCMSFFSGKSYQTTNYVCFGKF